MITKACPRCKTVFPVSQFYRDRSKYSGLVSYCKDCSRIYFREKNERYAIKFRERKRRYYRRHREAILKEMVSYYHENKDGFRARSKVRTAILNGSLKRGLCSICKSADAEAHHPDYSKPLEIIWLCGRHHQRLHAA
mgnify:CR=1 FL=1